MAPLSGTLKEPLPLIFFTEKNPARSSGSDMGGAQRQDYHFIHMKKIRLGNIQFGWHPRPSSLDVQPMW